MVKFRDDDHTYWDGSKQLISVSELIRLIVGNVYESIPDGVLKKAANFGTAIHEAIELMNETGIRMDVPEGGDHCLDTWLRIKGDIIVEKSEQLLHYKDLFAGTCDLICQDGDKRILADYKTTSKLHTENVTLQLNLYRIAYEWMTGEHIDGLRAYWLPKRSKGKAVDLELIDDDELLKTVHRALQGQQVPIDLGRDLDGDV